jgi:GAF domain-containing protein
VKYAGAKVGGLFILEEEEENAQQSCLMLRACYAYERKKHLTKKVEIGEGVIGQCYLEGETVYLAKVPNNYLSITSGLGDASPSSLLVIPLKTNDRIEGVLELASLKPFQDYEINFLEKLGELLASSIVTVRTGEKTARLLKISQEQAEEMRAQEEEMRQNMEELQATQEEVARKEQAYVQRIKDLENSVNNSDSSDLKVFREHAEKVEGELRRQVEELNARLANRTKAEDWAEAEDVEKTLKMNLEAIKITQEELDRKARH